MQANTLLKEIPAATTYLYKQQRNLESLEERIALMIGYVAGGDLLGYLRSCKDNRVEDGRPNILQAFVPSSQITNNVYKIEWTMSHMNMSKITNKL